jgi:hypothetical protein
MVGSRDARPPDSAESDPAAPDPAAPDSAEVHVPYTAAMRSRGILAAGLALLGLAIWQLQPILSWHWRIAPELRGHANAARLNVETVTEFPPAGDWPLLQVDELTLRAPILSEERSRCAECGERCWMRLEGGTIAIFDAPPPESYLEVLNLLAPDEDDISLGRSPARNWDAIDALAARVGLTGEPPETFRFRTSGAQGVVSRFVTETANRFVIYGYAPSDGTPARVVGVTGPDEDLLRRVLGSLEVRAGAAGSVGVRRCE